MGKPLLLQLSSVLVQQRDLLKLGMVIDSYNDHCSAPFSRACWLAYAPPTLLGSGSRHCHGINFTNYGITGETLSRVLHRDPHQFEVRTPNQAGDTNEGAS